MSVSASPVYFAVYALVAVGVLKEVNVQVREAYMDEPFHVGQAEAYCRGEWTRWDEKITTPAGIYVFSLLLQRLFMLKCTLPHLRFTIVLALLAIPPLVSRLTRLHQRIPPPLSLLEVSLDAITLASFPVLWFFGFLYYTDVPSVAFTLASVIAARLEDHYLASFIGLLACCIRQNNIIWVLYGFAYSQIAKLRFSKPPGWTDKPFPDSSLHDLLSSVPQLFAFAPRFLPSFPPYAALLALFVAFVAYNRGIALGDKANHEVALHIPQIFYFWAFATLFGWPILLFRPGGPKLFARDVWNKLTNGHRSRLISLFALFLIAYTTNRFFIEHPFLLSDNRHYTFYVWRRVFRLHPVIPTLLAPVFLICFVLWLIRVGTDQTLLQTLLLPLAIIPVLVPTPLLEPRYFVMPYILLRAQVTDLSHWAILVELAWYTLVNSITMYVFLYKERPGVGRFIW